MQHRHQRRLFLRFRDRRDYEALTRLFDATAPSLLALASHLVREVDAAEDLVQDTFLVAIERADAFDGAREIYPWLAGILVNKVRQWNRRTDRTIEPDRLTERSGEPDPAVAAGSLEVSAALHGALEELPEAYRHVLVPYIEQGEAPRTIADRLGIAPGTARVRIHRGLDMLRKALPAGFAAGGLAALLPLRGLDHVRATVLQQARLSGEGAALAAGAGVAAAGALQALQLAGIAAGLALASGAAWMLSGKLPREGTAVLEGLEPLVETLDPPRVPPTGPERLRDEAPVAREHETVSRTKPTPDRAPSTTDTRPAPEPRVPGSAALLGWRTAPWTKSIPPGHVRVRGGNASIGSSVQEVQDILATRAGNALVIAGALHAETPRHKVKLDDLHMLRTEVTVEQYLAYIADEAQRQATTVPDERALRSSLRELEPRALEPMVSLTYEQAGSYAAWAGLRLPTELEWEYAARGKAGSNYPWGESWEVGRAATSGHLLGPGAAPIASYAGDVTREGLFDMVGNVAEWTSSPYEPYPKFERWDYDVGRRGRTIPALPEFGTGSRVVRGGSFRDEPLLARVPGRRSERPETRSDAIGFRTAASAIPGRDAAALAAASSGRAEKLDLERATGIDRWWVRKQLGLVGPEGYEVIMGYDHVAFVPVRELSRDIKEMRELEQGEREGGVLVGLLSTGQPILSPALDAGAYLVRLVFEGHAGPAIQLVGVRGDTPVSIPRPMVKLRGGRLRTENELFVRETQLRIGAAIPFQNDKGAIELNFGIEIEAGPWRQ